MRRSAVIPVKLFNPPVGFSVRPFAGASEVGEYVKLHLSVSETKNMTVDWRTRIIHHPAYRPGLDIVIESPEGRLGAFCIGWLDEHSHDGRLEPLGCHKDFRRYGLGRVALAAVLQRLQSFGARDIYVETDCFRTTAVQLYESFGFEIMEKVLVYRKEYDEK